MSLYSRFCAWLSGWPESSMNASHGRSHHEEDMMFAEEEAMIRENNKNIGKKPKGLKPKKKKKSKK
ncbi:uncharacterized protein METZ01_LOCUS167227 [marine metagenome]|uniref:Uncharacterized protein n=1 Tax=marine metagenome TaxID=408172 RepID=A0A382BMQ1_9ZZZZ